MGAVELVGELVEDDVLPVVDVGRPPPDPIPRQHDRPMMPGLAEPYIMTFEHHAADGVVGLPRHIGPRVDQDRRQSGVVVGLAMQQEQTRLGRDRHADLIGDLQPAAALEPLLRQEDEDVPSQLLSVSFGQMPTDRDVPVQDGLPVSRERLGRYAGSSSLFESEHGLLLYSIRFAGSYIICGRRNEVPGPSNARGRLKRSLGMVPRNEASPPMREQDQRTNDTPILLTATIPGTGGVIKTRPEDFFVEELPLYAASGEGDHAYAVIEKRGLGTREAIDRLARTLNVSRKAIGSAGLKDTHAVTRQWVSVERVDSEVLKQAEIADIRIRQVTRHTNKLKLGHLAGNRFVVKLRDLTMPLKEAAATAEKVLGILAQKGVPNYYGPQRFGNRCDNHLIGKAIINNDGNRTIDLFMGVPDPSLDSDVMLKARRLYVEGRYQESLDAWPRQIVERRRILKAIIVNRGNKKRAFKVMDKHLKGFFVSAYQSAVFNRVLIARMPEIDKLLLGDMAYKHVNGASFRVEDAAVEQPRCDRFEISPTGPLLGQRTARLEGPAGEIEEPILEAEGLGEDQFRQMKKLGARGGRRPLRFQPRDIAVSTGSDDLGPYLELRFELDPGCYATTLITEITKNPVDRLQADTTLDEPDPDTE